MKVKKHIIRIGIAILIAIILYFASPYLLGINCESNDMGADVIGIRDSYSYDEEGNVYYGGTIDFYVSSNEKKC